MPASRWSTSSTTRPGSARSPAAHHVELGGFTLSDDGRRLVVVATEDNLLKGAATQALQNLNLAFGLDEISAGHSHATRQR